MTLRQDLQNRLAEHLGGNYGVRKAQGVPLPRDIPLGKHATTLRATVLFIDIRQSSAITQAFQRQSAAKMMKAYFDASVRIIRRHGGNVRSFNGDGMLALFVGDERRDNAVSAAKQVRWFVGNMLNPEIQHLFVKNDAAMAQALRFGIGCGVDDGRIYAVRIGIRGTNDVAWIGRATNTAAKLADRAGTGDRKGLLVTKEVFAGLKPTNRGFEGEDKWTQVQTMKIGGSRREVRGTGYWRAIR